jgi:hypothetical protein
MGQDTRIDEAGFDPVLETHNCPAPREHQCRGRGTRRPWGNMAFSAARVLYRAQGAGEGSANQARGRAAVLMPKQARGHQGAPREHPEKNGPRGLLFYGNHAGAFASKVLSTYPLASTGTPPFFNNSAILAAISACVSTEAPTPTSGGGGGAKEGT